MSSEIRLSGTESVENGPKIVIFKMAAFFESKEKETNEPGVKMTFFSTFSTILMAIWSPWYRVGRNWSQKWLFQKWCHFSLQNKTNRMSLV